MENLSRIAKGIFLGNGEIWNFLDYAVNRDCGGLMVYTQKNNFLGGNLINNFSGGLQRKYEYGDINPTNEYKNVSYFANNNIGDLYSVPEGNNSTLKFKTKDDFYYTHLDYRLNHWSRVYDEAKSYVNTSAKSYKYEVDGETTYTGLPFVGFGSEYDVNTYKKIAKTDTISSFGVKAREHNLKQTEKIGEQIGSDRGTIDNPYMGVEVSPEHPINYFGITDKVSEKSFYKLKKLDEIAERKRDSFKFFNRYFLATETDVEKISFADSDIPWLPSVNMGLFDGGLYAFYEKERNKYNSRMNGVKYPWNNVSFWTRENSYGVEFNERGQEYYSINEENKYEGDAQISILYNGGMQSQFKPESNARTYYYYEEKEKEEIPINVKTSTIDGSVVSLSDYNSSSRLLQKTNELFRQGKINSLVNRFHTDIKGVYNELTTAYDDKFGISRGRNLIRKEYEGKDSGDKSTGYDNPYCRTWTAHHQYSKLKDRIRPFVDKNGEPITVEDTQSNYGFLRTPEGAYNLTEYSVLRSDGFVRITPTHKEGGRFETPQNYMFSIENLAWRDVTSDINNKSLSPEQRGPNGGRIMWFPPYNLKFSENVNVNWNANTFIGRGEEIYTYTNTVRTGTLDFTLLIDHPSILNKWRGTSSEIDNKEEKERDLLRFFAGCGNINDAVEPTKPVKEEEEVKTEEPPKVDPKPTYHTKKIAYVVFFPNNFSGYDYLQKGKKIDDAIAELKKYNSNISSDKRDKDFVAQFIKDYNKVSEGLTPTNFDIEIKQTLFAGADDIDEIHYFNDLEQIGTQITGDKIFGHSSQNCKVLNVEVKGFASSHGYVKLNKVLCDRRRTLIEKLIKEKAPYLKAEWSKKEGTIINVPDIGNMQYVNAKDAKLARAAYAIVKIQWKEDNKTGDDSLSGEITKTLNGVSFSDYGNRESSGFTKAVAKAANIHISKEVLDEEYTYDNEYLYFSEVMGDALVHKHIVDKVRFFDPAFHSITPEGFNARLTFLHQCTRQGPTNAVSSGRVKADGGDNYLTFAGNLAFGRAPYCILRIGDFFNTKICIDSMSITYDNNGVQWDLNPEGAGVQPMYANVSLSFKFLGGQDLVKPIERLQNAVTANYYANASVYSRHADTNKYYYDAFEDKTTNKD